MDDSIRYREPATVPDGQYEGLRTGYRLAWKHDGREVDVMTSVGIRGMNVPSRFSVLNGKVVESSIESVGTSQPIGGGVREEETLGERLDHLERLVDTIGDETNWVRARDQIRAIRQWVSRRGEIDSVQ